MQQHRRCLHDDAATADGRAVRIECAGIGPWRVGELRGVRHVESGGAFEPVLVADGHRRGIGNVHRQYAAEFGIVFLVYDRIRGWLVRFAGRAGLSVAYPSETHGHVAQERDLRIAAFRYGWHGQRVFDGQHIGIGDVILFRMRGIDVQSVPVGAHIIGSGEAFAVGRPAAVDVLLVFDSGIGFLEIIDEGFRCGHGRYAAGAHGNRITILGRQAIAGTVSQRGIGDAASFAVVFAFRPVLAVVDVGSACGHIQIHVAVVHEIGRLLGDGDLVRAVAGLLDGNDILHTLGIGEPRLPHGKPLFAVAMIGERELHVVQALRQGFREDERRATPIVGHVRADTPSHLPHGHRIGGGGTCVVGTVGRAGGEFGVPLSVDRIAATVFNQRGDLHTGGDGCDERSTDAGSRGG
ncbi:Uncharacterised protein [Bifidobacterium pseudocatenulatum]|nr:Uncharacterised protein [Bifidobacterium pseudocatenulatum]